MTTAFNVLRYIVSLWRAERRYRAVSAQLSVTAGSPVVSVDHKRLTVISRKRTHRIVLVGYRYPRDCE